MDPTFRQHPTHEAPRWSYRLRISRRHFRNVLYTRVRDPLRWNAPVKANLASYFPIRWSTCWPHRTEWTARRWNRILERSCTYVYVRLEVGGSHYRWRPEGPTFTNELFFPCLGVRALVSTEIFVSMSVHFACPPILEFRRRDSTGEITPFLRASFFFPRPFLFLYFFPSFSLLLLRLFAHFFASRGGAGHAHGPRNWTAMPHRRKWALGEIWKSRPTACWGRRMVSFQLFLC